VVVVEKLAAVADKAAVFCWKNLLINESGAEKLHNHIHPGVHTQTHTRTRTRTHTRTLLEAAHTRLVCVLSLSLSLLHTHTRTRTRHLEKVP